MCRHSKLPWLTLLGHLVQHSHQYNASFSYPEANQTFNILDTIVVEWSGDFPNATLYTWIDNKSISDANAVSTYSYIDANGTFSYLLSYYLGAYVYGRNIDWPVKLWFDAIWDPTELGHRGGQNGDGFFVTSTSGVPTTYAREVTVVSTPHTSTSSATQVSSTSNSDSATSTPITVSSSQQNQSPSSTSATLPIASSGLSTGAKAGIAVGAVVGVIAIALFAWWFVRMQRQVNKLKNELALTQNALDPAASKPELAGKKVLGGDQAKTPVTTTNTVDRWELPSGATVAELGPERK